MPNAQCLLPPGSLDLHPASAEERAAAFRNVYDVWPHGSTLDEHLRRRLGNPKYDNAKWYVGCLDGQVVTSCGCYRTELCLDGQVESACAIGAVHTLAEFRGRGFAPRLLAFAEADQKAMGKTVSFLYSDIAPSYYERLGYVLCRNFEGWTDPRETARSIREIEVQLLPFNPASEWRTMAEIDERYHASFPLWVARPSWYWEYLISLDQADEFHYVENANGRRIGYLRTSFSGDKMKIRDVALADHAEETNRQVYAAAIKLACARGTKRLAGWMPKSPVLESLFQIKDRTQELTMVKPLATRLAIRPTHITAAEHFHEIDHV